MSTPSIQTLIAQAQQVLNLKSSNEIRATLAAILANANVGTPLNPNLTTQQLWDEFYEIVRQPTDDIMSIITDQMMRMVFFPPAPGGAGADKQVIFNDGGVLAGDAGLVYNKTTDALTIAGLVTAGSATITGALGAAGLNVTGATIPANGVYLGSANNLSFSYASTLGMTLNATGLGIGISPIYKFHVKSDLSEIYFRDNGTASELLINSETGGVSALYFGDIADTVRGGIRYDSSVDTLSFQGYNNVARLIIDSSGNVGIGVTATIAKVQTNGAFATTGSVGSISTTPLANALIGDFSTTPRLISTGGNTTTAGVHKFINASSDASVYLETLTLDSLGNVIIRSPATPATLTTNGQLTVNATSDTNLRFSYRGSDGTTRVANITLA